MRELIDVDVDVDIGHKRQQLFHRADLDLGVIEWDERQVDDVHIPQLEFWKHLGSYLGRHKRRDIGCYDKWRPHLLCQRGF